MKKLFLLGIVGFAVIWALGFFAYRIALACLDVYDDWQLAKEVREIERETALRRQERAAKPATPPEETANPHGTASAELITPAEEVSEQEVSEQEVSEQE